MTEISKLPANCVPLAFKAIFPEKSDEEILEALYKVKGFIPGKGGFWFRYVKVFDVFGVYYEEHIRYRFQKEIPQLKREVPLQDKFGPNHYYRLTLSKFIEYFPKGTFLIQVRAHALVVKDGVVFDKNFKNKIGKREVLSFAKVITN